MTGKSKTSHKSSAAQKKKSGKNREFAVIAYSFLAIFVCMMGYFAYFQFFKSEDFINSPYNTRQDLFARSVTRGEILSADGKILADTVTDHEGNETRRYSYGRVFSHVVGYSVNGKSGIESQANFNLLRSNVFFMEKIIHEIKGEKSQGDSVVTTLDYNLQITAYDALGDYDGAVVVLEPSTGKILAMVSKPDFDPNNIQEDWEQLISKDNDSSQLLNRATQGLYPPGSTFKIFTTLEYIHENPDYETYSYDCKGQFTLGNNTIHCHSNKRHGNQDLEEAFANSCNSSYASLGLTLDIERFSTLCDGMLFNTNLPTKFESSQSSFVLKEGDSEAAVMETAIGQGKTLVTPFQMALVTSAIANNGLLMSPYVIDHTLNDKGDIMDQFEPNEYGMLLSANDASVLQSYMSSVVENGTAKKLNGQSYKAAGKTGSAEFSTSSDSSHSWFVGYAGQEGKADIVLAVIVEDSGVGSEYAVPIAKQIFDAYYSKDSVVSDNDNGSGYSNAGDYDY